MVCLLAAAKRLKYYEVFLKLFSNLVNVIDNIIYKTAQLLIVETINYYIKKIKNEYNNQKIISNNYLC